MPKEKRRQHDGTSDDVREHDAADSDDERAARDSGDDDAEGIEPEFGGNGERQAIVAAVAEPDVGPDRVAARHHVGDPGEEPRPAPLRVASLGGPW